VSHHPRTMAPPVASCALNCTDMSAKNQAASFERLQPLHHNAM
jgi:hypothetical protein